MRHQSPSTTNPKRRTDHLAQIDRIRAESVLNQYTAHLTFIKDQKAMMAQMVEAIHNAGAELLVDQRGRPN